MGGGGGAEGPGGGGVEGSCDIGLVGSTNHFPPPPFFFFSPPCHSQVTTMRLRARDDWTDCLQPVNLFLS